MDVQNPQIPLERFLHYEVNYLLKLLGSNTENQIASILQLYCKINKNIANSNSTWSRICSFYDNYSTLLSSL